MILSTWVLFTVATAATFGTKRKAAFMDSGLLSTLGAINYDSPKYGGCGAGDGHTAAPRERLHPSAGRVTSGRASLPPTPGIPGTLVLHPPCDPQAFRFLSRVFATA